FDDGDWIDNTGESNAIWIYGTGPHICDIKAFDMAGNEAIFHIPLFLGPDLRFELIEPSDHTYTRERDHALKWKYSGPLNWTSSLIKIGENANYIDIEGAAEYQFKLHKDGEYLITLRLQDGFENYAEATTTVIKDTIDPKVFFRSPSNNSMFNDGEVSITWRGEDEFGIKEFLVRIDEGEWEGYGNSTIYNGIFEEGAHSFEITAIDNAGNMGYGLLSFNIDSKRPTVTITSPLDGTYTNGNYVKINWEITESNGIGSINLTVNGHTFVDLIDSTFYEYPTPKEREYVFMITVMDLAGNSNSDSVTIYNDRTKPDIKWIGLPEYFTNVSSLDFSWKITEQYLKALVFGYGETEHDLLLDQTSITIEVEEGGHEFYLKAEDMVGNIFSISHGLVVDLTPPTITIDWDRTLIKDSRASIYWSTEDNGSSELKIEIDDGNGFREALLGDRYTSDKLAQGDYYISIRATDGSGNTNTQTWDFFVNSQGGIGEKPDNESSSAPMIIGIMVLLIILIIVILIFVNRTKRNREEKKEITKAPGKPRKIQISALLPQVQTHGHAHAKTHVHGAPLHTSAPAPSTIRSTNGVSGEDSGYIRPMSRSTKKVLTRDIDTFKTPEKIDKKRSDHPVQKDKKRPEKKKDTRHPPPSEVPVVDLPHDEEIRSWDDQEEIPSWDDSDEILSTDKVGKKGSRKDRFPQEVDDEHIVFDDDGDLDDIEEFEEFENFE
ncbi:MAG: hypothetical protein KAH57_07560, partial [Thermoplasmata archaeon]|nr:hypothetical protein [Thermoplasmata archaeon]